MSEQSHKQLTASEMANLWSCYVSNSMTKCVVTYGLHINEDPDIQPHLQEAYDQAEQATSMIKDLFNKENFPVPVGFTEQDVNLNGKRLFKDTFLLDYLNKMGKLGTPQYGRQFTTSARSDVRAIFDTCLTNSAKLFNETTDTMLAKGLFIRAPHITTPKSVHFVKNKSYMDGFSIINKKRPLNAIEISHLSTNLETNTLGFMMCTAFGQTANAKSVRKYMLRGKDITKKHIRVFSDILIDNDIQAPMSWDSDITDSTEPVFSDKVMMYHCVLLCAAGIANYGIGSAESMRKDLPITYLRLAAETGQFANDGSEILIKNGWMEEPPQADDRNRLINQKRQ